MCKLMRSSSNIFKMLKFHVVYRPIPGCPTLEDADILSQTLLFKRLVDPCRFDRIQRPERELFQKIFGKIIKTSSVYVARDSNGKVIPVDIHTRIYVYFLENLDTYSLQFKMHAMLQLRYVDKRVAFGQISARTSPIIGEDELRKQLWVPHLFFANEK